MIGWSARAAGDDWEDKALQFLEDQGLVLVTRNHTCRFGELDLIMRDGAELVFVEVRYRRGNRFGSPLESVDHRKRQRLVKTARHYLQMDQRAADLTCRFDVVGISGGAGEDIEWISDAFAVE